VKNERALLQRGLLLAALSIGLAVSFVSFPARLAAQTPLGGPVPALSQTEGFASVLWTPELAS
jgi:hypothetical protein